MCPTARKMELLESEFSAEVQTDNGHLTTLYAQLLLDVRRMMMRHPGTCTLCLGSIAGLNVDAVPCHLANR